jgi:hypothetical protein
MFGTVSRRVGWQLLKQSQVFVVVVSGQRANPRAPARPLIEPVSSPRQAQLLHPRSGMPEMDVFEVTRIAREAAREQSQPVDVIGVVPGPSGEYAEILLFADGCAADPCLLEMGIFRDTSEADLRQTIAEKLRTHLKERHTWVT